MVYNNFLWHEVGIKICLLVPSVNWHMFKWEHHSNEFIVHITVTSAEFPAYNIKMLSIHNVSVFHDLLLIKFSFASSVLGWGTISHTFGKHVKWDLFIIGAVIHMSVMLPNLMDSSSQIWKMSLQQCCSDIYQIWEELKAWQASHWDFFAECLLSSRMSFQHLSVFWSDKQVSWYGTDRVSTLHTMLHCWYTFCT